MKREGRDSNFYLAQFDQPEGGCMALVCAIVNQAVIDYTDPPKDKYSKQYMSEIYPAKKFLKEWNILNKRRKHEGDSWTNRTCINQ